MAKPGAKKGTPYKFTPEAKATFLLSLAKLGSYKAAAASINVNVTTVYHYRKDDPAFQAQCDLALQTLGKELVSVARKLAIEGTEEKFYDKQGNLTRTVRRYNDKILLRMLDRILSDDWGDVKKIEKTVSGKVEHEHEHTGAIKVEDMTTEQQRAARTLLKTDRNVN